MMKKALLENMENLFDYMGYTYDLNNPTHRKHLEMQADVLGKTFEQLVKDTQVEKLREKVTRLGPGEGIETYEGPDGTIRYLENNEPLVADKYGRPLPPGNRSGGYMLNGIPTYEGPDGTIRYSANDQPLKADSQGRPLPPEIAPVNNESIEEVVTADPPVEQAPASADDVLSPAALAYYAAKDAKDGTRLGDWAANFKTLGQKNFEYQASRGRVPQEFLQVPENPSESFKNTYIEKAFGGNLSASDAQVPDFTPGSTNLNFAKGDEAENQGMIGNQFTDFSRNNISPAEVMEQNFVIEKLPEMEDDNYVDYSTLYKSFEPEKLF